MVVVGGDGYVPYPPGREGDPGDAGDAEGLGLAGIELGVVGGIDDDGVGGVDLGGLLGDSLGVPVLGGAEGTGGPDDDGEEAGGGV